VARSALSNFFLIPNEVQQNLSLNARHKMKTVSPAPDLELAFDVGHSSIG